MSEHIGFAEGAFLLSLPPAWRVEWARGLSARVDTGVRGAPLLIGFDSVFHPDGLDGQLQRRRSLPAGKPATLPEDYEAVVAFDLRADHRGQGPHIVASGQFAFPPDIVRHIEWALPLPDGLPAGLDIDQPHDFINWAMKFEPLSSLLGVVGTTGVATEVTPLDRVARRQGLTRHSLRDTFHLLLPDSWVVEPDDGRFLVEEEANRDGATLWLEIAPVGLGGTPNDALAGRLLRECGERVLALYRRTADVTVPASLSFVHERETVVEAFRRYTEDGELLEDRCGLRTAMIGPWQIQVFHNLVYPVARLADPEFLALRDDLWGRFLDGWIAPEV